MSKSLARVSLHQPSFKSRKVTFPHFLIDQRIVGFCSQLHNSAFFRVSTISPIPFLSEARRAISSSRASPRKFSLPLLPCQAWHSPSVSTNSRQIWPGSSALLARAAPELRKSSWWSLKRVWIDDVFRGKAAAADDAQHGNTPALLQSAN